MDLDPDPDTINPDPHHCSEQILSMLVISFVVA